MSPVSATYFGISGYVIFWVMFLITMGLFVPRMVFLYRLMRLGKPENRFDRMGERIKNMFLVVIPQWCTLKSVTAKDLAGIGHAVMFWGFSFFLLSYIVLIGFSEGLGLRSFIMGGAFETAFLSILDIAAVLVMLAMVWAAIRRYIVRPARLEISIEAGFIMFLVFILMALHLTIESFAFAAQGETSGLPPITTTIAGFLTGAGIAKDTLIAVSHGAWWLHYTVILVFTIYIPRSKHLHVLASAFNVLFRPLDRKVVLEPIPLEALEAMESEGSVDLGVSKLQDLKWKDILDTYACAKCGRCHVGCPAQASGKTLSPREFLRHIKDHLLEDGPQLLQTNGAQPGEGQGKNLIGDVVTEDEIWACTTCGACQEVCPVSIEHVRKLIQMRQNLVLAQNKMPESAQLMLRNMQTRGNPWAGAQSLRLRGDWTNDMGLKILGATDESVDTLFWVGCTGALIDRNVLATLSLVKVLKAAGVDFGVLGEAEPCCGDPARRAGYEFQFQISAEENIEIFRTYNIKKIITSCPHCYNALKNEYPLYGGDFFQVVHYTQVIADLLSEGKLKLASDANSLIAYHDPCYLSRYNEVYKEPRRIIESIPKTRLKEMERSKKTTFCCGGGGGHMWIEEQHGTTKINHVRMDEVIKTGADTVVTSCPYCLQMLEEGIEQKGVKDSLKAKDLIEVVEAAMKQS
ncbi:MAG TPA: (Fe-S)-binding protein [Syntrophorhabdaceae bacterium]|nr:(Fe-S)-binding protein [Syntrophorhabdaceae bacterium]